MLVLAFVIIAVLAGTDQLIKFWITEHLSLGQDMEFLRIGNLDIMHLYYVENTGSAFSMFSGQRLLLLLLSIVGILTFGYILIRHSRRRPVLYWSMVLCLGGASGNLIDRIARGGAVVDYLDLQLFRFATFNFADCCVTIGTILLLLFILFSKEEKSGEKKAVKEVENDQT